MKKILVFAAFFSSMLAYANDHTIVVRGAGPDDKDVITVVSHGNSSTDTLTVHPGKNATTIIVALKDIDGTILEQHQCAAAWNDQVTIIAPSYLPNGYFLEVRDDKGFVYKEFNQ